MNEFNLDTLLSEDLVKTGLSFGYKVLAAIAALILGFIIINAVVRSAGKLMAKREMEESLQSFLKSLLSISLRAALIIAVLSTLGIEVTAFVALLGAAGIAIGAALSGTLQNFAGGVMILLFKPFKVGDFIEAQGYAGSVREIQIFNTILKTLDNRTVIIPNGGLSTGAMVNFSTEAERQLVMTFGIGYGDDVDKAKEILKQLLNEDDRILKDKPTLIAVSELADSSVNFTVRGWLKASDYFPTLFSMNEKVYHKFNEEGLNIPFPQMDVHVHQQS